VEGALPASTPRSHLPGAHAAMVAAEEPSAHEPAAAAHRCGRVGEELPAPQGISQPPVRRQVQPPEQIATQDEEPRRKSRADRGPPRRRPSTRAALSVTCIPLTPDRTTGASTGSESGIAAIVPFRARLAGGGASAHEHSVDIPDEVACALTHAERRIGAQGRDGKRNRAGLDRNGFSDRHADDPEAERSE